jgi:hypothetical protein
MRSKKSAHTRLANFSERMIKYFGRKKADIKNSDGDANACGYFLDSVLQKRKKA